jgi:hypothetical protein
LVIKRRNSMLVVWEPDDKGNIAVVLGVVNTDEEARKIALENMAAGHKVLAGDVVPVTLTFSPAAVTIKRATGAI